LPSSGEWQERAADASIPRMNGIDWTLLGKQVELVQDGLRKARAEVDGLNKRFDGLEARIAILERQIGKVQERIAEVGFKVDDLKSYVDIRFDAMNARFDTLEALIREAIAK
jgi:hypothetical protein